MTEELRPWEHEAVVPVDRLKRGILGRGYPEFTPPDSLFLMTLWKTNWTIKSNPNNMPNLDKARDDIWCRVTWEEDSTAELHLVILLAS